MIIRLCNCTKKLWEYGLGRTILAVICAHSISISIGISQGYSAILLPQLSASHVFHLDPEAMSWIASLGAISNPIGSILSGVCAECFGRKAAMQLPSLPFVCGWLWIAFATKIQHLYVGRLITGIAAGMSPACYTYVSEVSMSEHRGLFQALGPVSASFGILLTYVLGYYIHWKALAFISVAISAISFLAIFLVPESPAYLARTGRGSEAFDSLLRLRRRNSQAQKEHLTLMNSAKHVGVNTACSIYYKHYLSSATIKPFLILLVVFILQESSGIYSVLFYAVSFFHEANLNLNEHISSIIVGVIRFFMSIVAAFLINKYPRKTLFMVSSSGMAISMATILLANQFIKERIVELTCILFTVLFSMIGMLPIPWILTGELFPLAVRSLMSGVVICIAQSFIFASVKIYPNMIALLTYKGTIGVFAIASLLALVFSKLFLPETKNKSLEEIEEYFRPSIIKVNAEATLNDFVEVDLTFVPNSKCSGTSSKCDSKCGTVSDAIRV